MKITQLYTKLAICIGMSHSILCATKVYQITADIWVSGSIEETVKSANGISLTLNPEISQNYGRVYAGLVQLYVHFEGETLHVSNVLREVKPELIQVGPGSAVGELNSKMQNAKNTIIVLSDYIYSAASSNFSSVEHKKGCKEQIVLKLTGGMEIITNKNRFQLINKEQSLAPSQQSPIQELQLISSGAAQPQTTPVLEPKWPICSFLIDQICSIWVWIRDSVKSFFAQIFS